MSELNRIKTYQVADITVNGNLSDIISNIGSNEQELVIGPGTYVIDNDLIIPKNVMLVIKKGALLQINTGVTLTINGPFEAGLYQVFDCLGTGSITFSAGSSLYVFPDWWKNNTSPGTTDMTDAIKAALASSYIVVKLSAATYRISSTITLVQGKKLKGMGRELSKISHIGTDPAILITYSVGGLTEIKNLWLYGNNVVSVTQHGIYFEKNGVNITTAAYVLIENLYISNFGGDGIKQSTNGHINNIEIRGNSIKLNSGNGIDIRYVGSSAQVNAIWIHHNDIGWNKKNGILFVGNNVSIDTNTIQRNDLYAISIGEEGIIPSATGGCMASRIIGNYTEQNSYSIVANAAVIGLFSYYTLGPPDIGVLIRSLKISDNYFGESQAKFRSVIYADALDGHEFTWQSIITTENNYMYKPIIYVGNVSALSSGSAFYESSLNSMPDATKDSLTKSGMWIYHRPFKIPLAVTLEGAWVDYSTTSQLEACLEGTIVHIQGSVKNGTGIIFYLPARFRPKVAKVFSVLTDATFTTPGAVIIGTNGSVTFSYGNNARVILDGISFDRGGDM